MTRSFRVEVATPAQSKMVQDALGMHDSVYIKELKVGQLCYLPFELDWSVFLSGSPAWDRDILAFYGWMLILGDPEPTPTMMITCPREPNLFSKVLTMKHGVIWVSSEMLVYTA